ncbi:unnamed protein product [Ambrosiozyma monospora]|uniref:Unnamed protein product n=1 Tax=Ambrosiozyma monospora TaxID=43982 RepID=A0ACB5T042_AMBMO|nr:unnamed protein product [Ambrosiozyma monospora]
MFSKVSVRSFATSIPRAVKVSTTPSTAPSAVSTLKVIIKNAGSKSGPAGLAHLAAASSFLDTVSKTGLRLKRESELLGGEYKSSITRDNIILEATFLKENLPYFVNVLGNVLTETQYKPHELKEIALPYASAVSYGASSTPSFAALEELHAISFRKGLGNPLYYDGSKSYTSEDVAAFAKSAISSESVEIVGENVVEADLSNFVKQSALSSLPEGTTSIKAEQKIYTGVESRVRKAGVTSAVIGVPVSPAQTSAYSLLAAYVSANLQDPHTASVETKVVKYDSASLFYVSVSSSNASEVSALITDAAKLIKSGADLSAYKALASYQSGASVSSAPSTVSVPALNLSVVGDIDAVPHVDEL